MSSRVGNRVGIGGGPDSQKSRAGTPMTNASRPSALSNRTPSGARCAGAGAGRNRSGPLGGVVVVVRSNRPRSLCPLME